MACKSTTSRKPVSERISMFESSPQPRGATTAAAATTTESKKAPLVKTLSGKNFGALKSQFDAAKRTPESSSSSPLARTSSSGESCKRAQKASAVAAAKAPVVSRSSAGGQKTPLQRKGSPVKSRSSTTVAAAGGRSGAKVTKSFTSPLNPPAKTSAAAITIAIDNGEAEATNDSSSTVVITSPQRIVSTTGKSSSSSSSSSTSRRLNSPAPADFPNVTLNVAAEPKRLIENNNNFVTSAPADRYWTNQALRNDNSQKMNEALKLDLEYKGEKIASLSKELEELQIGGGASEEELGCVKRQKNDLEMRLKDQEEELDDLAGQVQMLEQAKIKLEMSMAAAKKEHRREVSAKDDELEDARTCMQKKVKALEQQLENEHEERIVGMREKHELETKIINLREMMASSGSTDDDRTARLKRDLKRTKALLKDAQLTMDRSRSEASSKAALRQLKNQLEDAEFARTAAVKTKQNLELEVSELQQQLDDVMKSKSDLEDRMVRIGRDKTDLSGQLEENEEEMREVMKKYKACVSQLSVDQITIQQQAGNVVDLEDERNRLKERLAEMCQKIESLEGDTIANVHQQRLELKIKELETKLELEATTRLRMDTQIFRLKEAVEKLKQECDGLRAKESSGQDQVRRLQRQLRDLKDNHAVLLQKETEANGKKNELEKKVDQAEAETIVVKNDLKLALKRIDDLQTAINGELDSDSDSVNSDGDSDSSDEDMGRFLEHHRRACSIQRDRESIQRDVRWPRESRQLPLQTKQAPEATLLNDSSSTSPTVMAGGEQDVEQVYREESATMLFKHRKVEAEDEESQT